jgi:hypothetical protein
MAQLFLPRAHTEADLVLAGQIAELIDSAELYVAWTAGQGRAVPEVAAELRTAAPSWAGALALIVRELWRVLARRDRRRSAIDPPAPASGDQPVSPAPGETAA